MTLVPSPPSIMRRANAANASRRNPLACRRTMHGSPLMPGELFVVSHTAASSASPVSPHSARGAATAKPRISSATAASSEPAPVPAENDPNGDTTTSRSTLAWILRRCKRTVSCLRQILTARPFFYISGPRLRSNSANSAANALSTRFLWSASARRLSNRRPQNASTYLRQRHDDLGQLDVAPGAVGNH